MVHPPRQTQQEKSVAKPRTPLLIIPSLECKSDTKEDHSMTVNLLRHICVTRPQLSGDLRQDSGA